MKALGYDISLLAAGDRGQLHAAVLSAFYALLFKCFRNLMGRSFASYVAAVWIMQPAHTCNHDNLLPTAQHHCLSGPALRQLSTLKQPIPYP